MEQPWDFSHTQFHFDLRIFTTSDTDPVDWSSLHSSLQPDTISNSAWSTIYGNLTLQLGNNWAGYVQLLDNEAAYLGQLGEDVTDVNSLWGFAVQQADNALSPVGPTLASATDDSVAIPGSLSLSFSRAFAEAINARDQFGPLGYGWSTPWQTMASTSSDGTVTITGAGGADRIFQPDSRATGVYFSQPGDTGILRADGQGGLLLTEADGTATDYNANGTLNYIQDTNGNRITAGYTIGRWSSLTASSGQSITIGYNSAGLISTVTDSEGRITTYAYDPTNQYLISVTGFNDQITSYTYNMTSGSAAQNALASIAFPGSTHQYFSYDSEGRLAGTFDDGGAQPQSFAYSAGQVSVTNGTGDTSRVYYNEQGLVIKSFDPLGNVTFNTYDNKFNLVSVTNAAGQSESYTYNSVGEVASSTDFLGNTTYFTYSGPFHQMASMIDANGNATKYAYNSSGDLLTTTYADGTSGSSSTYNPLGEATSFLNANGQPIQYTYNTAGQIATESFSNGSQYAYTYDAFGKMLTATDSTDTTTFTYDPVTQLMTEVLYPTGMYLKFSYNSAGQRTQMVDQTGFTTNYSYDSVGRLSELTDGSGNSIVSYTYDADGRLSLKVNGNSTYTTYVYDADGNVLHLINYAPDSTTNSRFDYTYNALGLETTEATPDGSWTYTYDADGQLIHAVFASMNPSMPSQDLGYSYDPMGNRITTAINGVITTYTTNTVNEYTNVGGVAYQYDANGNLLFDGANTYTYNSLNQLVSVTGPGGTTTYSYNALGQRIAAIVNGETTQYLFDPSGLGNVVGTYSSSTSSPTVNYTYGLGLTSRVTVGATYSFDFDALGSTSGLSDSSGSYVDRYEYLPFGTSQYSAQAVANPFQFGGASGVSSGNDGLVFMRARIMFTTLGRFLSSDPLSLQAPNVFAYASNSPTNALDPSGLSWISKLSYVKDVLTETNNGKLYGGLIGGSAGEAVGSVAGAEFGVEGGALAGAAFGSLIPGIGTAAGAVIGGLSGFVYGEVAGGVAGGVVGGWIGGIIGGSLTPNSGEVNPGETVPDYPVTPPELPPWWPQAEAIQMDAESNPRPFPPNGDVEDKISTSSATSMDPNSMIGPAGYGPSNIVALGDAVFPYQIDFENSPSASAPAQSVTITDQIDPNLDWTSFQLTGIAWVILPCRSPPAASTTKRPC